MIRLVVSILYLVPSIFILVMQFLIMHQNRKTYKIWKTTNQLWQRAFDASQEAVKALMELNSTLINRLDAIESEVRREKPKDISRLN